MFPYRNLRCLRLLRCNVKCENLVSCLASMSSSSSSWSSFSSYSTNHPESVPNNKRELGAFVPDSYGQPTFATHPHLLNEGDLVPGIGIEEFRQRRMRLMAAIQKFAHENVGKTLPAKNSNLLIIPSATKKYMSDNIPYVFRQNSDFMYMSGCMEPDSVLMLTINNRNDSKSILFMRPKDKHAELWDGPRTGVDNAVQMFGVDEAYPILYFQDELKRRIKMDKPHVWYDSPYSDQRHITSYVHEELGGPALVNSPANFLQSMRLFKSPAEQALMRRTCRIASRAINEVMREARPGLSEHHIFAMVDYKCRMNNASFLAYPPVVASGHNATTIHYINNTQLTKSGDLVLLDAGCEYGSYTSDITRTWPINGEFTEPQKVLYDVVLHLQKELIATMLKEGGETLDNLFDTMCIKLGKYLQEVGLVPKDISDNTSYARAGYKFCPHHVSHYLGLDVHDTPLMPRTLRLLPGVVCTVEPGIYIGHDRTDVSNEFRGMGVRIEDDILITADNKVEVLSAPCEKERSALENLFKEKSSLSP